MNSSTATACCFEPAALTPASVANRPGLSALVYRVGTHASFKHSMLAALSRQPALRPLTTRYDDDPTIALLDGWAAVLDVLTFYQERIANEGFLGTATERRSLLELARQIGYELGPGVAANTYLAFTLDAPLIAVTQAVAASTPTEVTIPIGTKAQSIPGQDELPQTFETVQEIVARVEWNALKARAFRPLLPTLGSKFLYLAGTATNLKPGDAILITGRERAQTDAASERWDFRRLRSVEPDPVRDVTKITWDEGLGYRRFGKTILPAGVDPKIYAFRARAAIFGHNAQDWRGLPNRVKADYLGIAESALTEADKTEWPSFKIYAPVYPPKFQASGSFVSPTKAGAPPGTGEAEGKAPASGVSETSGVSEGMITSAPIIIVVPTAGRRPDPVLTTDSIDLDATYPGVIEDSWIVLVKPNYAEAYEVKKVTEASRAEYLLSGKTTRLRLEGENLDKYADEVRTTTVFLESEHLPLGEEPLTADLSGISIELDSRVEGLEPGRLLSVTGLEAASGDTVSEVVTLDHTEHSGAFSRLFFTSVLRHTYRRDGLALNANVAPATHGETKTEILGSGNGASAFQRFTLKFKPLTFISAATPSGTETTLEVRVDGVLWKEVPSFYGIGPEERVYVTRRADNGAVTVQFGDGITGARLPSGQDNITATYRTGIGTAALLKVGQISLLMSRPLGLKEVVNPEAPDGAADPEQREQARDNAPLTVLTLDRIVSLPDYENFTRAFAGIAKARATPLWNGEQRLVHLTVAGPDGAAVDASSALYENLLDAIDSARHADQRVRVASYTARTFNLTARVQIDPACVAETVLADASESLQETFSFAHRGFGEAVTSSEVIATLQAVKGVTAVVLDAFHFSDEAAKLHERLPAAVAQWDNLGQDILPAELLTLNANGLKLTELTGV